ncbi:MAG: cobalamin biosynthesis protein [Kiloniellaceae bacterium]
MSWSPPPGAYGAADPLFLLLIALAVEAYLGDRPLRLRWMPNPRRAVAAAVLELDRRLDRPERGARALRTRGAVVAAALALGALGLGWLAALVTRHYPFAWVAELFLLILLVEQRGTWRHAAALGEALRAGSLVRAREALRPLVVERLGPGELDALGAAALVEAALSALGRRFAARLAGPVFWYVLLGLPGLFLQQAVLVMAVTLGAGAGPFGEAARTLARAVAFVPGYLSGLVLAAAAAFVPGGRPAAAAPGALAGRLAPSGVLAAALGHLAAEARLSRALAAFAVACLINAGLIAVLALVRLGL